MANSENSRQPMKLSQISLRSIRKSLISNESNLFLSDPMFFHMLKMILLKKGNEPDQYEVCWILTNIAGGESEKTKLLVSNGLIPIIVDLLDGSNVAITKQALWSIANVIGDGAELRDEVLKLNFLDKFLKFVENPRLPIPFNQVLAWTLSNIVRSHKHQVSLDVIQKLLPAFYRLYAQRHDVSTRSDVLWGLTSIIKSGDEFTQTVINGGIVPFIITNLPAEWPFIQICGIRMLGFIASGTVEQKSAIIQFGLLDNINDLLCSGMRRLRYITIWCISNISSGPIEHVEAILQSNLLGGIVAALGDSDITIVKNAVKIVRNITVSCPIHYMIDIIDHLVAPPLFDLINDEDPQIASNAREALQALFDKAIELINDHSNK